MNHIARLTMERDNLRAQLAKVRNELTDMERYYTSDKFSGPDNDYAHVRTDLLHRLSNVRFMTIEG
jgi:hypothetical protein